jgi:hypothetical protein
MLQSDKAALPNFSVSSLQIFVQHGVAMNYRIICSCFTTCRLFIVKSGLRVNVLIFRSLHTEAVVANPSMMSQKLTA